MDARKAEQEGRLTDLLIESPAAMAKAITPHLGSIWRYALSLSGKPDLADDLTQSTVLRAMEKHLQFRRESNLTAWCLSICRSIWLNELRGRSFRKTQSISIFSDAETVHADMNVEASVFAKQVFSKVMELPEAQHQTVIVVYVEGFKYTEAAAFLDIPVGTVMSRLAVARSKLKHLGQVAMTTTAQGKH